MKPTKDTQLQNRIGEFVSLYNQGVTAWIKAGEIIVELVENDPLVFDKIIERCPHVNAGILGRFEQMGRRILHPQLLISDSPGFERLSRMPFSVQERHLDEPIPLVVETDSGTDVLLVQAKNLTRSQAKQVFAQNHIRTEGEQKAYLIDIRSKNAKQVAGNCAPAWRIRGGRVEFMAGATLSAGELATIITQLTK